jgi:hypothetical protein
MKWSNTIRAIAYLKDINDISVFEDYCKTNQIGPLPVCYFQSDICRPELLFEIEIDLLNINPANKLTDRTSRHID